MARSGLAGERWGKWVVAANLGRLLRHQLDLRVPGLRAAAGVVLAPTRALAGETVGGSLLGRVVRGEIFFCRKRPELIDNHGAQPYE